MRILANENFPSDAVEALQARGHDVAWVRTDAPGSRDPQVLTRAQAGGRILVTSMMRRCGWLLKRSNCDCGMGM